MRPTLSYAVACIAALTSSVALADEPRGLAAAFGNTIKALYPDGRTHRIWLQPDGGWEAVGRTGKTSSGRWTLKGEKVCLKQSRPIALPISYCAPFPVDGSVGAVWAGRDMSGESVRMTLVKGFDAP